MHTYVFRIAVDQQALERFKPFDQYENPERGPVGYARLTMRADGIDSVCETPPDIDGSEFYVSVLELWLEENGRSLPPSVFDLDSCTPREIHTALASPKGRAMWAWEVETDDQADFDYRPPQEEGVIY